LLYLRLYLCIGKTKYWSAACALIFIAKILGAFPVSGTFLFRFYWSNLLAPLPIPHSSAAMNSPHHRQLTTAPFVNWRALNV